ncbi:hypothetical protein JOC34_002578 [Virgibacillus halotolerans]|nr:hypothetical protein [Virgibacillus halotolerans]
MVTMRKQIMTQKKKKNDKQLEGSALYGQEVDTDEWKACVKSIE